MIPAGVVAAACKSHQLLPTAPIHVGAKYM